MEERRYAYSYATVSHFEPAVLRHSFKLRMIPCQNYCQHIEQQQLSVLPHSPLQYASDGFGNLLQFGYNASTHEQFQVMSEGVVSCCRYVLPDAHPDHLWLCPSPLATWDATIRTWALQQVEAVKSDPHQQALTLMHAIFLLLTYERYTTDNATTALQVFQSRKGVCQDFAHLMIAACRSIGLRARYVNGLVEGEGETHAWVEVHDGQCWHAYDPTHDRPVEWGYIKLAHGRDVSDCPSNRGHFFGWTAECMEARCTVTRL